MTELVNEYTGLAAERFLDSLDVPRRHTMPLEDEAVRHTLLWLCEGWANAIDEMSLFQKAPCAACGHDRRDHVVGGDADNPTPWPCNFPHTRGAPAILCYCGDYQPLTEEEP